MTAYQNTSYARAVLAVATSILESSDNFKKTMRQSTVNRLLHLVERLNTLVQECRGSRLSMDKLNKFSEINSVIGTIDFRMHYLIQSKFVQARHTNKITKALSELRSEVDMWKKMSKIS